MKNVFARTVLALVLIPSFWMTAEGTGHWVFGEWVEAPGENVGEVRFSCHGGRGCVNPPTSRNVVSGFSPCVRHNDWVKDPPMRPRGIKYVQFVPDFPDSNLFEEASGSCYYYEAGSSSGESGPHTWRWDE
jgi:hypothetical protein